jgi:hypothetical protein
MTTTHSTHGSTASTGAGLLFGVGAATLGVFAGTRPLVGVAAYVIAVTAALVLSSAGDTEAFAGESIDAASPADVTLGGLGVASAVVFPGLVAADGLGHFSWTALTTGVAFSVAGLFGLFGLVSLTILFHERQR